VSLGIAAEERGDFARAESLYLQALENARQTDSKLGVAIALNNIGNNARGDHKKAARFFRESLQLAQELGEPEGIAIGLSNLGLVAHWDGDNKTALRHYREAFDTANSIGFTGGIIWSALGVAAIEIEKDAANATRLLGAADALLSQTGRVLGHEERRLQQEVTQHAQAILTATAFLAAMAEGRQRGAATLLSERLHH
jgi:tetratricopeptide (TPR) repeat protein